MENSKSVNKIIFYAYEKCINTLKRIGIERITQKLYVETETVEKWIKNENRPSDYNILALCNKFSITLDDLGAVEVNNEKDNTHNLIFSKRLIMIMDEKQIKASQLALRLNVVRSAVANWRNKNIIPKNDVLVELASELGVTVSYLLGYTDIRNGNNESITEALGMDDKSIATYKKIKNSHFYGSENDKRIKNNFGFTYIDISNYIASNSNLVYAFFNEANRVLEYNSDFNYYEKFNNLLNRYEIDADIEANVESGTYGEMQLNNPYQVDITDISKQVLHRIIDDMFDKFIADKIKQNNLHLPTLDELSKMLNNK